MFFVFGMAIYSVYIFRFYRFLARKNIFDLDFKRYETSRFRVVRSVLHLVFYIVKYLMLFPCLAFFWFAVMTLMLAFLGKNQTTETTLMVSMAVVSAVRITAYYDENLSDELAKILPFALLGVFLVEPTYFSFPASINLLQQAITQWENMAYYLLFVVALEFVLRLTTPVLKPARTSDNALIFVIAPEFALQTPYRWTPVSSSANNADFRLKYVVAYLLVLLNPR